MNYMLVNLVLAFVWFAVAILLFVLHQAGSGQGLIPIRLDILALILAIYNLVRWWSMRVAQAQRRQDEELPRKPSLHRSGDNNPAPDPNFDFTAPSASTPLPPGTNGSTPEKK